MNLVTQSVLICLFVSYTSAHSRLLTTNLDTIANTIRNLDDQPLKIASILAESLLAEPDCEDVKEFVPGRPEYRKPILENFYAQKIPLLLQNKLRNDHVKIVVATTWKKTCGIGYYARQMITTLEKLMPGCTDIDIAELQKQGQPSDGSAWPQKTVIGSAIANENESVYQLGKLIADGDYDVILLENEHFLQQLDQLNRFIDGIDYKGEGLAQKRVLVTLHTIWIDKNITPKIKKISTRIAHFLQLFDYECLYLINFLGIDRDKCVSINDAALGKGYRDREKLKKKLGLSGRKVIFNYGIMGDHKAPSTMANGVADASQSYPELLFLGVGFGAERYQAKYKNSQNVLFVGKQISNEMVELLASAADMFIMGNAEIPCTLFVSGTLTYGFSKGLPLISTELSYAQFMVRDEETGYLVARYQSEPIKKAVLSYFNKSQEQRDEQYRQLYCKGKLVGWETIGKEYAALFTMIKMQENINQYKEKQVVLGKCDEVFRLSVSSSGQPNGQQINNTNNATSSNRTYQEDEIDYDEGEQDPQESHVVKKQKYQDQEQKSASEWGNTNSEDGVVQNDEDGEVNNDEDGEVNSDEDKDDEDEDDKVKNNKDDEKDQNSDTNQKNKQQNIIKQKDEGEDKLIEQVKQIQKEETNRQNEEEQRQKDEEERQKSEEERQKQEELRQEKEEMRQKEEAERKALHITIQKQLDKQKTQSFDGERPPSLEQLYSSQDQYNNLKSDIVTRVIIFLVVVLLAYFIIIWRLRVRLSKMEQRIEYQQQSQVDHQNETELEVRQ